MQDHGGTLGITLSEQTVTLEQAKIYPDLSTQTFVVLKVSDTGPGMDSSTVKRIFEPFFTTKAPGGGTGMGLAVAHSIVKSLNGEIIVDSKPGRGTFFEVYFPPASRHKEQSSESHSQHFPDHRSVRIMVIDDQPSVADMVGKMLQKLNYETDVFYDSETAVKTLQDHPDQYQVILTDYSMPGKTGLDVAKEVNAIKRIPVFLMTGYGDEITRDLENYPNIYDTLKKPIKIGKLAETVIVASNPGGTEKK
ncbi:MAG: ATP-binding protein [candidate division KSB1 bacterium]|nr:ATP-binding protein [candidate division KSB1 bacterium]